MIKNKKFLYIFKIIVFILLFLSAIYFENAQRQRLMLLIIIFALFLVNNGAKYFVKTQNKLFFLFLLDIGLIYGLESNSRLLINYFFHSFYIIIFLEASLSLQLKRGIIVGIITLIISMIKYAYLIYYKFNLSNVSQMLFFLMVNILILVVGAFAQHAREENEKKDILYKELLDTHKKLKEYTHELNRLSLIEERNKIARDIHDNLGHNMTALIMELQMVDHYLQTDMAKSKNLLNDSLKTARKSLSSIREVVETLRGKPGVPPEKAIRILVEEFSQKTGTQIDLTIEGEIINRHGPNSAIYHILQEGLTNAVRHGKADRIWVSLKYSDQDIKFRIEDNGQGALAFIEGYGIRGIKERVRDYDGRVDFTSHQGFLIEGMIRARDREGTND